MFERGIAAASVSYAYGASPAVQSVSLSLQPGEAVALTGPNGSGKTTLLRLLSRSLVPADGTVTLDGVDLRRISPRALARQVAVVPQQVEPSLALTVEAMVALGRTPYSGLLRPASDSDRAAIEDALVATDVGGMRRKRFNELSGGEQQRVALAMAVAQETPYLLLDEPTVHLDLHHQHAFFELLHELRTARNLGILAVIHDLNLAALHFQRMVVLEAGAMRADGPPAEILRAPGVMRVFKAPLEIVTHPQTGSPQVLMRRGTR